MSVFISDALHAGSSSNSNCRCLAGSPWCRPQSIKIRRHCMNREITKLSYGKNGWNFVFKVSICFRGLNDMCRALASNRYVLRVRVCDVASKVVVVMLMTMAKWTKNPSATTRIWYNQDKFAVVKMWRQWKMDQRSVGRRRSDESVCVHCHSYLRPVRVCVPA